MEICHLFYSNTKWPLISMRLSFYAIRFYCYSLKCNFLKYVQFQKDAKLTYIRYKYSSFHFMYF